MKTSNRSIISTSPLSQPARKPRKNTSFARRQRLLYGGKRRNHTVKERDKETGLYYYGARYLDSRTGRWISGDPAMGEYVPEAPVNDEARKRNGNLPGMGGVFNYVNLHVYHYAGNNPVKYTDPNGEWVFFDDLVFAIIIKLTNKDADDIWTLTATLLKHSWSSTLKEHFKLLASIIKDAKPLFDKVMDDGELNFDENVKIDGDGLHFGIEKVELTIFTEKDDEGDRIIGLKISNRRGKRAVLNDEETDKTLNEEIEKLRKARGIGGIE